MTNNMNMYAQHMPCRVLQKDGCSYWRRNIHYYFSFVFGTKSVLASAAVVVEEVALVAAVVLAAVVAVFLAVAASAGGGGEGGGQGGGLWRWFRQRHRSVVAGWW